MPDPRPMTAAPPGPPASTAAAGASAAGGDVVRSALALVPLFTLAPGGLGLIAIGRPPREAKRK